MPPSYYPLSDILAVARVHPFYSDAEYPPTPESLVKVLEAKNKDESVELRSFPVIRKDAMYKSIGRLSKDLSPNNGYRIFTYISITGGGSGGTPMAFATDAIENRKQRAVTGSFVRACGLVGPGDWVLSLHISGDFYRALDLCTEILECAGASVLCGGHSMPYPEAVQAVVEYKVNVVIGDGSQLLQLALYVSSLPHEKREPIKLTKAIYTSEQLVGSQRAFFLSVFKGIQLCSILGSAEAGPWAVGNSDITGNAEHDYADFIYDTRSMIIEIFPLSLEEPESDVKTRAGQEDPLPEGEKGIIVQTSLQRLRNPLLRYVTGDVGSLHPLPEKALSVIPAEEAKYMKILRLYGRDRRFSFKWFAVYFEMDKVEALMRTERFGVLQWQIILSHPGGSPEVALEMRILRSSESDNLISVEDMRSELEKFFGFLPINEHLLHFNFIQTYLDFERSKTGNKVIKFIDRTKS